MKINKIINGLNKVQTIFSGKTESTMIEPVDKKTNPKPVLNTDKFEKQELTPQEALQKEKQENQEKFQQLINKEQKFKKGQN